jgi:DedD protein
MNMDRALKERIIGATILVLFVVLVVPVFLDGPENDNEVISQTVPLPGQSGNENQTIVLHRDREHPVPTANASKPPEDGANASVSLEPAKPVPANPKPAASEPQRAEPVVQQEPAPQVTKVPVVVAEKSSSEEPSAEVASETGMWAVQLGSFGNQENADKLAADLRKQNFTAFLSKLSTGNGDLHRVRIGPQKDRESAEKVAEQLAKAGHKGQVVPHP